MNVGLEHPSVLALLPLALLPWYLPARPALIYPWLGLMPPDRLSEVLDAALRLAGSLAIGAIVLGLAGPYRAEASVERVGRGSQIVLLLDRSRSMDMPFVTETRVSQIMGRIEGESKISVARRLLSRLAARRADDQFAVVEFSTYPMHVLDFTRKQELVQAVIRASMGEPGLADTDIGLALEAALALFEGRPYAGSRIILLVSDGGAHIDEETRRRIAQSMKRERVGLYWIYLRSYASPGLMAGKRVEGDVADTVPEHFLHEFFTGMGTPYSAYEAENPDAVGRAIGDVDRAENLPIRYTETLPRLDLSQPCFVVALVCVGLLLAGRLLELEQWA